MEDFDFDFENAILAVDSHFGVYTPQVFIERYAKEDNIFNIHPDDKADILDGPDNVYYWDAWINVLDRCKVVVNGILYAIHDHEGDIWLYQSE